MALAIDFRQNRYVRRLNGWFSRLSLRARIAGTMIALVASAGLVLSARDAERDRVLGLRTGADDYLVKPFGLAELHARVEAVLRRARPRPAGVRDIGRLRVDLDQYRAYVDSSPVVLTRKEFQVLAILAAQPGVVVRRDRLVAEVWHTSWLGTSRTLDVHIATLRAKIGDAARLETVRGVGFRIDAVATPAEA